MSKNRVWWVRQLANLAWLGGSILASVHAQENAVVPVSQSAALSDATLSLYDAFLRAKQYDASFLAAQSQWQAAVSRAEQAKAGLRPQIGLAADATWSEREALYGSSDSRSTNQNLTLSASQPLYRPVNRANTQLGALGLELAQVQRDGAEHELILRVAQAYFDVLSTQDALRFVQALSTTVRQQLAAAKRRFEVGSATIIDTREAQAQFDRVTAQMIQAENEVRIKRMAFAQLVGHDLRNSGLPQPLNPKVELKLADEHELEDWVKLALNHNFAVRQAQIQLRVGEQEILKAKAAYKPTLDVVGRYAVVRAPLSQASNPQYSRTNSTSIGLQLNWPIYTGGAIESRLEETLALAEKAQHDAIAAERSAVQAARAAYFGVASGLAQVKALEAAEISGQSAVDANRLGYDVGAGTAVDVLNAQSQLFQVNRDLSQARYALMISKLRLKWVSAQLSANDLQMLIPNFAPLFAQ